MVDSGSRRTEVLKPKVLSRLLSSSLGLLADEGASERNFPESKSRDFFLLASREARMRRAQHEWRGERRRGVPANAVRSVVAFATGITDNARHHNHRRHKIPDGFVLRVDPRNGQRFLVAKSDMKGMDEKKYIENRRRIMMENEQWPTVCGPKKHLTRFGNGVYLYFDFIRFTTITNFFLAAVLLVNIIAHFYFDGWKRFDVPYGSIINGTSISFSNATQSILGLRNNLENLFVSSYSGRARPFWFFSTLVGTISLFLFGPSLAYHIRRHFRLLHLHDHEDKWHTDDLDIIRHKDGSPKNHKFPQIHRILFSYVVFILMLVVSALVTTGLNLAYVASLSSQSSSTASPSAIASPVPSPSSVSPATLQEQYESNKNYVFAVVIAIFLALSNYGWWKLCEYLTIFEAHYTWTVYRQHLVVKYYIFKLLNLTLVFLTRWAVHNYYSQLRSVLPIFEWIGLPRTIARVSCSLIEDSEQFLILIILDLSVNRVVGVLWPLVLYKCWACTRGEGKAGKKSDKGRPDFDVAVEYLELLYRQFILYLGFPIFPPLVLITLIGNLIEYPTDKWVLLNLSRTPPHLGALIAVAIFPIGIGWTLSGYTYQHCAGTVFDRS